MSILASLAKAYERLPNAPAFGYSSEKIGFVISLNEDGTVAQVIDWREGEGKKARPRLVEVPASYKRPGITPRAFFLWDNSAYVLGVSADDSKDCSARHAAFKDFHVLALADSVDPGLVAVRSFLEKWTPDQFQLPQWSEELKDQNIIFALESERQTRFIHQSAEARSLWARISASETSDLQICLVTGEKAPVARLHQAIKGVWGGQVAGGSIVSFNLDAFTSYGHEKGDNAPVSEAAAFAYITALNRFLERDSGHRIQIADASTVFWADAQDMETANLAEAVFGFLFEADAAACEEMKAEEKASTRRIGVTLEKIRQGLPLGDVEPELRKGVRFYVLGLAPNAARLSVRFYFEDDFGQLTENYQRFIADMHIEPPPRGGTPPLWRYLQETAVLGKRENITPNLAGEWMRAILAGSRFPLTLMSSVLTRIRADGEVNALRAGILKALLIRNFKMEAPVALDADNTNRGYVLGRLFALYEEIQRAALGGKVNATIKDKFYGSASATPRKVFAVLESGSANHLAKVRKTNPGREVNLQRALRGVMDLMRPNDDPARDPFPVSLTAQEQAWFGLGYHHQRSDFFKKITETASEG
ncbi:type I-C CRISPR-associated protein Cas8c/Csd1 [Rhizobium rhizosphaerae]|uniref:Type I-C CRISPR-associated protein Cas8c/Csd1 n=1 Tax=Xaviernesmea rhizosphaerae TaxID=1672749 RepID=A0A1Q9APS9_9HYPH|nr:type I-C CRISPR-associated protein Cas8c/Csd1 [Xaviernesmea rhizosphaerae]OLP57424.1 type I-C CRISPR-associated protein Cas8c/Csd1 [Xaviernesmea rhizosphaerae]